MISGKKIIALTAVFVALVIAVLVIAFVPFGASEKNTDEVKVFETEKDSITGIDIYLGYENFSFEKNEDIWVVAGAEHKKLKASAVDELAYELATLTAVQMIDNPGEDSVYGFDRPNSMVNVKYEDTARMFIIGNPTSFGDMYYFKGMNEPEVYAISSEKANKFMQKLADYRDKTIISMTADTITEVVVKNGSQKTVFTKKNDKWTIAQPFGVNADSKKVEEKVISPLSYLTVLEFVEGDDYTGHGIAAEEKVVYVEDNQGGSERIIIGNRRDNGEYYIKTESSAEIYKVEGSSLEFVELDIFEFTENHIFDIGIDVLSKATIKADGKEYVLSISNGVYKVNGIEILKDEFAKMYENLSSLEAEEHYTAYTGANADATIDYTLTDGKSGSIQFVSIDDASYAVKIDGQTRYKLSKGKVSVVLTAINSLIEK